MMKQIVEYKMKSVGFILDFIEIRLVIGFGHGTRLKEKLPIHNLASHYLSIDLKSTNSIMDKLITLIHFQLIAAA